MKFEDKYPNVISGDMPEDTILVGSKKDNCYICGALTQFIDIDFQTHICSEECLDKLTFQWATHH